MAKKNTPEMSVHSIRLSNKVWTNLRELGDRGYRTLNSQVTRIIEDWLVEHCHMEDSDRSRFE